MSKKIIITGSNGQLGQYLIKYLLETQPYLQIIGTIRHKSYDNQTYIFDRSQITLELMDLSDAHSIEDLIIKYKPDYFVNTAANAFVAESWALPYQQLELNTIGVLHQLEAIRKHSRNTRYFNMGTSEEFACCDKTGKPQDENTVMDPKSPYGCAKACSRYLINVYRKSYNLYAIQGWTYNFESPLRGIKYVTKKITNNIARIKYELNNLNTRFKSLNLGYIYSHRSWQHAKDVADGIWRMLNQEVYNKELANVSLSDLPKYIKPYVLSGTGTYSVKDFVELAFKYAGIESGRWIGEGLDEKFVINFPCFDGPLQLSLVEISKEFYRPVDVTYLYGDASLIKKELGWSSTVSFNELVKEMVEYDIQNYKK